MRADDPLRNKADILQAMFYLRAARELLKRAEAPRPLRQVRLSLVSAGGALRRERRRLAAASAKGAP